MWRCRFEPDLSEPCCQVSTIRTVLCDKDIDPVHNSLDLSWNYASESQAYDRVHRLGQEKEVVVKRLVVNNTLEERYVSRQTCLWAD